MKSIALFAALLFASPSLAQGAPAPVCALSVQFGSYAMGIDRPTLAKVERLLKRDRGVVNTDTRRWGREGEVTLCVTTRRKTDTTRLFGQVKALFPRKPRGPLTVETATGRKFAAGATR